MKHLSLTVAFLSTVLLFSCSKKEDDLPKTPPEFNLSVSTKLFRGTVKLSISSAELNSGDISKVEYFLGETSIGVVTQSPFELDFNTENIPDGKYIIKAIVTRKSDPSLSSIKTENIEIDNILYTVGVDPNYLDPTLEMWIYLTDEKGTILDVKQIKEYGVYRFKAPKDFKDQIVNVTTGTFDPNGTYCFLVTDKGVKTSDSIQYNGWPIDHRPVIELNLAVKNVPTNVTFAPSFPSNVVSAGYNSSISNDLYKVNMKFEYSGVLTNHIKLNALGADNIVIGYFETSLNSFVNGSIVLDYNNLISIENDRHRISLPASTEPLSNTVFEFYAPYDEVNRLSLPVTLSGKIFTNAGYWLFNYKNDPTKKYMTNLIYRNKNEGSNIYYNYTAYGELPQNITTNSLNVVSKNVTRNNLNVKLNQARSIVSVYLIDVVDNNETTAWLLNGSNTDAVDFVLSIPKEVVDRYPIYNLNNLNYKIRLITSEEHGEKVSFGGKQHQNTLKKTFSFTSETLSDQRIDNYLRRINGN